MSDAIGDRKAALRARMRALRDAIPAPERSRLAALIEGRLFELPAVARARTALLFDAFGSEVPTAGIAERFRSGRTRVLLPFLREGTMGAAEAAAGPAMVESGYGPREPADPVAVDPASIDVVLTPGLAFDRRGGRLGYGRGHFDAYLRGIRPGAVRVGLAFGVQLVEAVPMGALDERVDVVVTESETVVCGKPEEGSGVPIL